MTAPSRLVLALVWVASALYAAPFIDRGWVPHDEGMLGHNAERVARGELPHADFDESYTGGLSQLHALAFRLLGVRLVSLRFVLFGFFLVFVPALYGLASRLLPPWPAGLLTLVGVAWSLPNYFASMPSWYVLFFSTFGIYCLMRELETGRRRWLLAAGFCAGLALLVIVVGLYFVAAALLYLAFREQALAENLPDSASRSGFFFFEALAVCAFLALLIAVVSARPAPMELVELVAPVFAVSGVLLARCWGRRDRGTLGQRVFALGSLWAPFALGVSAPIAIFLLPYVRRGALGDLYRGLFVLPFRQIAVASMAFPPLSTIAAALPYALLLAACVFGWRGDGRAFPLALGAVLLGVLVASGSPDVYRAVWHSTRSLGVIAVLVGCVALLRPGAAAAGTGRMFGEERVFLLLSMAALLGLIQFPYAAPIYFCFVAPIVALALAAIAGRGPLGPHGPVAAFYLCFAVVRLNPGYVWDLGIAPRKYAPLADLGSRSGLAVPIGDREMYSRLVSEIGARSRGPFIYATPDCPEVYFLSGRRNPTRVVFDYLHDPIPPPLLLRMLAQRGVDVVVVNEHPDYSSAVGPPTLEALAAAFPNAERIGKFVIRWRP